MRRKEDFFENCQEEYFELVLNVEESRIPIDVLCKYLNNSERLIKAINRVLCNKYNIEFELVAIDVLGIEPGSIRIPIRIKKTLSALADAITIGQFIYFLLSNTPIFHDNQVNDNYQEPKQIERSELMRDPIINDTVSEMARLAVQNSRIRDLSMTYQKSDSTLEKTTITKEMLSDTYYDTNYYQTIEKLEILSPSFDGNSEWRFLLNGRKIKAKMRDYDFIDKISVGEISFSKGDVLIVEMRVNRKQKKYEILDVLDWYSKRIEL